MHPTVQFFCNMLPFSQQPQSQIFCRTQLPNHCLFAHVCNINIVKQIVQKKSNIFIEYLQIHAFDCAILFTVIKNVVNHLSTFLKEKLLVWRFSVQRLKNQLPIPSFRYGARHPRVIMYNRLFFSVRSIRQHTPPTTISLK